MHNYAITIERQHLTLTPYCSTTVAVYVINGMSIPVLGILANVTFLVVFLEVSLEVIQVDLSSTVPASIVWHAGSPCYRSKSAVDSDLSPRFRRIHRRAGST